VVEELFDTNYGSAKAQLWATCWWPNHDGSQTTNRKVALRPQVCLM